MIFIIWPTIRPAAALERARSWIDQAVGEAYLILFGVNSSEDFDQLRGKMPGCSLSLFRDVPGGVTYTATLMTRSIMQTAADRDIIILASDDYEPPPRWDEYLKKEFESFDGCLIANDHPRYTHGTNIVPIPIMSGKLLRRLNGIVYHPAYNHFYSDQELYYIVTELGAARDLRGTGNPRFEHKHWSFDGGRTRDRFDDRNSGERWDKDKATYESRTNLKIASKLVLPEGFP